MASNDNTSSNSDRRPTNPNDVALLDNTAIVQFQYSSSQLGPRDGLNPNIIRFFRRVFQNNPQLFNYEPFNEQQSYQIISALMSGTGAPGTRGPDLFLANGYSWSSQLQRWDEFEIRIPADSAFIAESPNGSIEFYETNYIVNTLIHQVANIGLADVTPSTVGGIGNQRRNILIQSFNSQYVITPAALQFYEFSSVSSVSRILPNTDATMNLAESAAYSDSNILQEMERLNSGPGSSTSPYFRDESSSRRFGALFPDGVEDFRNVFTNIRNTLNRNHPNGQATINLENLTSFLQTFITQIFGTNPTLLPDGIRTILTPGRTQSGDPIEMYGFNPNLLDINNLSFYQISFIISTILRTLTFNIVGWQEREEPYFLPQYRDTPNFPVASGLANEQWLDYYYDSFTDLPIGVPRNSRQLLLAFFRNLNAWFNRTWSRYTIINWSITYRIYIDAILTLRQEAINLGEIGGIKLEEPLEIPVTTEGTILERRRGTQTSAAHEAALTRGLITNPRYKYSYMANLGDMFNVFTSRLQRSPPGTYQISYIEIIRPDETLRQAGNERFQSDRPNDYNLVLIALPSNVTPTVVNTANPPTRGIPLPLFVETIEQPGPRIRRGSPAASLQRQSSLERNIDVRDRASVMDKEELATALGKFQDRLYSRGERERALARIDQQDLINEYIEKFGGPVGPRNQVATPLYGDPTQFNTTQEDLTGRRTHLAKEGDVRVVGQEEEAKSVEGSNVSNTGELSSYFNKTKKRYRSTGQSTRKRQRNPPPPPAPLTTAQMREQRVNRFDNQSNSGPAADRRAADNQIYYTNRDSDSSPVQVKSSASAKRASAFAEADAAAAAAATSAVTPAASSTAPAVAPAATPAPAAAAAASGPAAEASISLRGIERADQQIDYLRSSARDRAQEKFLERAKDYEVLPNENNENNEDIKTHKHANAVQAYKNLRLLAESGVGARGTKLGKSQRQKAQEYEREKKEAAAGREPNADEKRQIGNAAREGTTNKLPFKITEEGRVLDEDRIAAVERTRPPRMGDGHGVRELLQSLQSEWRCSVCGTSTPPDAPWTFLLPSCNKPICARCLHEICKDDNKINRLPNECQRPFQERVRTERFETDICEKAGFILRYQPRRRNDPQSVSHIELNPPFISSYEDPNDVSGATARMLAEVLAPHFERQDAREKNGEGFDGSYGGLSGGRRLRKTRKKRKKSKKLKSRKVKRVFIYKKKSKKTRKAKKKLVIFKKKAKKTHKFKKLKKRKTRKC